MVTWLSYDDLTDLVVRSLFTPDVGHLIVYGASANRDSWWDNSGAAVLGFAPKDSSEPFRAQVEAQAPLPADDPRRPLPGRRVREGWPLPFPQRLIRSHASQRRTYRFFIVRRRRKPGMALRRPGLLLDRHPRQDALALVARQRRLHALGVAADGRSHRHAWRRMAAGHGRRPFISCDALEADAPCEPRLLAAVTHAAPGMRFNDGRCDRQGRFLAGTMVMDMSLALAAGKLYRHGRLGRVRPDGRSDRSQRPGLQPGRQDDVPVGFPSIAFIGLGLRLRPRHRASRAIAAPSSPPCPRAGRMAPRWTRTAATGSAATMPAGSTAIPRTAAWTASWKCPRPRSPCAHSAARTWARFSSPRSAPRMPPPGALDGAVFCLASRRAGPGGSRQRRLAPDRRRLRAQESRSDHIKELRGRFGP